MGLDATIYLDAECDQQLTSIRIGNACMVGHLYEVVEQVAPQSTVLLGKVLYSGIHCGDALSLADIRTVLKELSELKQQSELDRDLEEFVKVFGRLCETAIEIGRPITF